MCGLWNWKIKVCCENIVFHAERELNHLTNNYSVTIIVNYILLKSIEETRI